MRYHDLPHYLSAQFEEASRTYAALCAAEAERKSYTGSLYWGKQNGVDYLMQSTARGKVKRLGVRSAETEARYEEFIAARQRAKEQHKQLASAMKQQQKLNRVLRVGHVPAAWIRILNGIRSAGLEDQVTVIGTAATYAYEFASGVRIDSAWNSIAGTAVLAERCSRLQLAVPSPAAALQLLAVIQHVAPTFQIYRSQRYLAIDRHGLEVSVLFDEAPACPDGSFSQSVVGSNGEMASMRTVDPRSFVLHRLTLANQPDRDPLECRRDSTLAKLVMAIVRERLEVSDTASRPQQFVSTKGKSWSTNSMTISA